VPSSNRLLASLTPNDLARLRPDLHSIELKHEVVPDRGRRDRRARLFPHSGIISLVVALAGGQSVEAAMMGATACSDPRRPWTGGFP
jgi:hypothetical protein